MPSVSMEDIHEVRPTSTDHNETFHASQQTVDTPQQTDPIPPEGGLYGWAVILACFFISFWSVGTVYSWGVLQAALFQKGLSSPSTLSWIGSITFTCISIFAIINARLIQVLGARKTAFIGLFMLASGEILSGFMTDNTGGLFVTAGILPGIGLSLCYLVVNVVPSQWFNRRKGLANGIVCTGGGIGGTVISLSMNAIIQRVGIEWAFRILGIMIMTTGIPIAWLIRERNPTPSPVFIEWSLFRDFKFAFLFLVGAIATFALLVPPFFVPLYSASLDLSPGAGAALIAGFNISSAAGRLMAGIAADAIGPLNTLFIGLFMTTISLFLIWPFSTSLGPLVVFVIINGASNGGFFATIPTVVRTTFGLQRVAISYSMVVTGWAGGYLMGAPIAGYLLEFHGGDKGTLAAYHPVMFYAGSMALLATGLVGMVRLKTDKRIMKKL